MSKTTLLAVTPANDVTGTGEFVVVSVPGGAHPLNGVTVEVVRRNAFRATVRLVAALGIYAAGHEFQFAAHRLVSL